DERLQIIAEGLEEWTPAANSESIPDEDVVPVQPTVVVAPATDRAWRRPKAALPAATNGNGNGNGHANGNGHKNGNGNGTPEIVVQRVRVIVQRDESPDQAINRLGWLDHQL